MRHVLVMVGLTVAAAVPPAGAAAQQSVADPMSQLQNLSPDEIARRIRASGLSEAQIRDRLRQAGYDPRMADRYFADGEERLGTRSTVQDASFLEVLRDIGVTLAQPSDTLRLRPDTMDFFRDSLAAVDDSLGLRVFGIDVFRRRTTQFEASVTGPVGPDYPLGPGDEVFLVLTGDVEQAYRLSVTREGTLLIPDVGQISVNGLTLGGLEDVLYSRLGRVYSGISRRPDATTRFDVSIGRLRTNQVYVVGEAVRPGAYRISSVGTLLEALYLAAGPKATGSFRSVTVRRNGRLVGQFDLYAYLTEGRTDGAPRLQEGDVVFIPPVGAQVELDGEVLRPAIYEILPGEGLDDLLRYAGGLLPSARTDVISVERIVPRSERVGGRDRIVVDMDFDQIVAGLDSLDLRPGDRVDVWPVLEARREWVEIEGAVYRPGRYQLRPESTVGTLIERAGGALPDAFNSIVHVTSLNLADGSRSLLRVPISVAPSVPLREFDRVTLFGRDSLLAPDSVGVYGMVNDPGRYPLFVGASAEDVILMAGGLRFGADPRQAEVTRLVSSPTNGTSVSRAIHVALPDDLPYPGPASRELLPPAVEALAAPGQVTLEANDEVYVRQIPQYREPRRVVVNGEAVTPGIYVLETMDERVSSVIGRAGGLTDRAFLSGFRLIRDGITVGVDLAEALANPGSLADPVLDNGDRLVIPTYNATVLVSGAVAFETRVVYQAGMDLDDVLSEAGGVTARADQGRISVEYANGSRRTVKRILGINVQEPEIRPGSTVFVPAVPEDADGFDWDTALTRVLAVASTLATVIIAAR